MSSPNPSKPTFPALPTSSLSAPFSPWCSVLSAERPKSSKTDLASSVCLAVALFGRSAAQILQNGLRQLRLLGCAACSPSGGPFLAAQQPKSSKTDLPLGQVGCAPCSPSGGPFWPLSCPNPPTRTLPPWSAWLPPLVVRFGRSAAQILQNGPRQLGLLGWAPCSALVVRFGRSAAQIFQNGPRKLGLLGCAPCSPSGSPFWPLKA